MMRPTSPDMLLTDEASTMEELPPTLRPVVAALVKHAFGLAIGTTCALGLGGFAAVAALSTEERGAVLFAWLIGVNFLPGYAPTLGGVVAGLLWGFAAGYVLGFGLALARNRLLKFIFWIVVTRERFAAGRNVLDELM